MYRGPPRQQRNTRTRDYKRDGTVPDGQRGKRCGGGGRGTQWAVTVRLYWLRRGRRRQQCTARDGLSARGYCRLPPTVSSRGGPPKTGERARALPADRRRRPIDFRERARISPSTRFGVGGGRYIFIVIPGCCFETPIVASPRGAVVGLPWACRRNLKNIRGAGGL